MKLFTLIRIWLGCLAFLLSLPLGQAGAARPNVLFIAVDDLNDWVGALGGHPQARTPNMDRLAKRGLLFTNAHCSAPGCNASRSSLLTGLRPSTTGIYANAHDWRQAPQLKGAVTLPRHFKNNGYLTLGTGKLFHAHTFFDKKNLSGYPDPDAWADYFPSKTQQMPEEAVPEKWPVNSSRKFYGGHFDWSPLQISNAEMADAKVVSWAAKQLAKRHEQPLFLSVGIYRPHVPWYAPQKYFDRFPLDEIQLPEHLADDLDDLPENIRRQKINRSRIHQRLVKLGAVQEALHGYLACMSYADAQIGRVLDALDAGPYADNTIIVLWSDHGYHHGEKGDWGKHTLWERTSNVPFVWAGPGVAKGATSDVTVSLIDMYPTFVELCDLPKTPHTLEGTSIAATLADPNNAKDREVYLPHMFPESFAIMNREWRYIRYKDGSEELYNVQKDPNEWRNLAEQPKYVEIKKHLAGKAPKNFAKPVPKRKSKRDLILEGETFRWKK